MRTIVPMIGLILLAGCSASPEWPERTVRVALEAPNPCWSIRITALYRGEEGVLAVSRLQPPEPGRMCAQVITTVSHQVKVALPEGPLTHLVLGREWNWGEAPSGYEFIASRSELESRLAGAELLHRIGDEEGQQGAGERVD